MKAYEAVALDQTSAIHAKLSGQFHAKAALPPGEIATHTHWIGGWNDD
jgi:hypothetical protein